MARVTMEQRFREQVIADLSELKTSNKNIVEHLLRLNGSVAKHEEAIGKIQLHDAREAGKDRTNATWIKVVYGIAGAIGLAVLEHFGTLIAPWLR